MTTTIHRIEGYGFSASEAFLLDANVWIYLYVPQQARGPQARAYSKALSEMMRAGSAVFVDVLVLSEFVNRYARLVHQADPRHRTRPFKQYRRSAVFGDVAQEIAGACRRILRHSRRADDPFASLDMEQVLSSYEARSADFNDLMLVELCRENGLNMVTHDEDFRDLGVTVLTANPKLLGRR